ILTAILREEPKPASQVIKDLPHEAEKIIIRCLRKDPARRFQTMADLKVTLEELKDEPDSAILVTTRKVADRRRWSLLVISGLLFLCAAIVLAWFFNSRTKEQEE